MNFRAAVYFCKKSPDWLHSPHAGLAHRTVLVHAIPSRED